MDTFSKVSIPPKQFWPETMRDLMIIEIMTGIMMESDFEGLVEDANFSSGVYFLMCEERLTLES
jgi:hypothetical protein